MLLIFAFGTVWFWLLIALAFILVTVFVEREDQNGGFATSILLISVAAICFLGNLDSLE